MQTCGSEFGAKLLASPIWKNASCACRASIARCIIQTETFQDISGISVCVRVYEEELFLVGVASWLKWADVCSLHPTPFPDTKCHEAFCTHTEVPEISGNVAGKCRYPLQSWESHSFLKHSKRRCGTPTAERHWLGQSRMVQVRQESAFTPTLDSRGAACMFAPLEPHLHDCWRSAEVWVRSLGSGPWSGMGMDQMKIPIEIPRGQKLQKQKFGAVGDFL